MPSVKRPDAERLAVLIDAENASAQLIEPLLSEIAKYGTANVKRIYGDWTTPNLAAWKNSLNKFAIRPIQQFRYTSGKNASDSALIIDAMDLLYSNNFDGFCIVSSDSDFTGLASRLRESGIRVYGFGEKKTPESFVRACDRFIFVENLSPADEEVASDPKSLNPPAPAPNPPGAGTDGLRGDPKSINPPAPGLASRGDKALGPKQIRLIRSAYEALAPEGGWIPLGNLSNQILKLSPSFDPRTYGHKKLSGLINAIDDLQIEYRTVPGKPGLKHHYVRLKS